ncbi:signal transduction histidine kinase [Paracoccus acridae]|uniref:histidine kinase n=1 Tax=Paracoccus acridae TaxID=1795310 RepID=A0ABQ1VIT7_9RHOB|nr:PAS domain-containing protein [Paracoccus acridae]GGF71265.1 signal transduction histidine kinase [Paracoccus acridae]
MSNPSEERRIDLEIHRTKASSDPFAAAMRATRMPMLITDPRQPDNPIVFVNDAFGRLTGYTREETLGRNCRFLQGPGTNVDDVDRLRQAIARRVPVEVELLNYKKDGGIFWNRVLVSPVFDGDDLTYFFASQLDVTKDKIAGLAADGSSEEDAQRRIADLIAAEDRLHFTLKAGGLGTWTLDIQNQRLVVSALCKANFGRGPSDEFGYQDLQSSIHPEDYERWQRTLHAAFESDGNFHIEYRINLPQGGLRWIEIRAKTRFDDAHRPVTLSGISLDITERKEAEAYRALVTQEMNHRIKNTLATVQSIVSQSLRAELPSNEMRKIVAERIEALSGAHDILAENDWDVAGLRQTVERALRPFNADGRIHYFGSDLEIRHAVSSALTLALHELATNALKYGALSGDSGRVRIEWSVNESEFVLTWDEIGGPEVTPPTRTGFGSRMIEKVLSATVEGSAGVEYRPQGIHFELRASMMALTGSATKNR